MTAATVGVYCPVCTDYTLPCRGICLWCGTVVMPQDVPRRATRNRKRLKRQKPEPAAAALPFATVKYGSRPCCVTGCTGRTRDGGRCLWHRQKQTIMEVAS